jgi:hypothetical protein
VYLATEYLTDRYVQDSSRRIMVTSGLPLHSDFNCKNDSLQSHNLITSVRQSLIAENNIDFPFLYRPLWNCYQLRNESINFLSTLHFPSVLPIHSFFSASHMCVFRPLCLAVSHNGEFLTGTSKLYVILP